MIHISPDSSEEGATVLAKSLKESDGCGRVMGETCGLVAEESGRGGGLQQLQTALCPKDLTGADHESGQIENTHEKEDEEDYD